MEAIIDLPVANLKYERQTKDKLTAQRHAAKVGRRIMGELKRLEGRLEYSQIVNAAFTSFNQAH
jgi:hypothetical protein